MASSNPFGIADARLPAFCGRRLTHDEWTIIREIVDSCGLSRTELAATICEALDFTRPNGGLKVRECFDFLLSLEPLSILELPAVESRRPQQRAVAPAPDPQHEAPLEARLADVSPVSIELVSTPEQRVLFRSVLERHHYLGFKVPYGASLRYLVSTERPTPRLLACFQFSSPAWRLAARDRFLGWDDATRRANLQKIVNNSRFLILPSVRVSGLASHLLSRIARRIADDWEAAYAVRPVLLETFVETARFDATSYRAANWLLIGQTAGRGRQDREHTAEEATKALLLYPLVRDYRLELGIAAS